MAYFFVFNEKKGQTFHYIKNFSKIDISSLNNIC